jgi:DNA-binding transcriptional LysR family regulator
MDLTEAMRVFVRVAETGSFSAVARERGVTQPTITKRIAELERRAGVQLMMRNTRGLNLTDAGARYYARCRDILADVDDALSSAAQSQSTLTGTLRINVPMSFGKLYLVSQVIHFMQRYPSLQVDLIMNDRFVDIVEEGVDLAIRIGKVTEPQMIAKRLGRSPRVLVGTPEYFATHGEPQEPKDLASHNCIVYSYLATRDEWELRGPKGDQSIRVRGSFRANNAEALREAALAGMGIALLPMWMVGEDVGRGRLRAVLKEYMPPGPEISAVYPMSKRVLPKVRYFIEHLEQNLKWEPVNGERASDRGGPCP